MPRNTSLGLADLIYLLHFIPIILFIYVFEPFFILPILFKLQR